MPEIPIPLWAREQNHFIAPIQAGLQMGNLLLGMKAQRQQMEQQAAEFPLKLKQIELQQQEAAFRMAAENEKLDQARKLFPLELDAKKLQGEAQSLSMRNALRLEKLQLAEDAAIGDAAQHDLDIASFGGWGTDRGVEMTAQTLKQYPGLWGTDWHKAAYARHQQSAAAKAAAEAVKVRTGASLEAAKIRADAVRNKITSGSGGPDYDDFIGRQMNSTRTMLENAGVDAFRIPDLALAILDDQWAVIQERQKAYTKAAEGEAPAPPPLERMTEADLNEDQKIRSAEEALRKEDVALLQSGKEKSKSRDAAAKLVDDLKAAKAARKAKLGTSPQPAGVKPLTGTVRKLP